MYMANVFHPIIAWLVPRWYRIRQNVDTLTPLLESRCGFFFCIHSIDYVPPAEFCSYNDPFRLFDSFKSVPCEEGDSTSAESISGPFFLGKLPIASLGRSNSMLWVLDTYPISRRLSIPDWKRCCRFSRSWVYMATATLLEIEKMMPIRGARSRIEPKNPNQRNSDSRSTMKIDRWISVIPFISKYGSSRFSASVREAKKDEATVLRNGTKYNGERRTDVFLKTTKRYGQYSSFFLS